MGGKFQEEELPEEEEVCDAGIWDVYNAGIARNSRQPLLI
jgi:hypothetical protein